MIRAAKEDLGGGSAIGESATRPSAPFGAMGGSSGRLSQSRYDRLKQMLLPKSESLGP